MKVKSKSAIPIFLLLLMILSKQSTGQFLKANDFIISSSLTDNYIKGYNVGLEYFYFNKNPKFENSQFSIAVNSTIISTKPNNEKITGYDFTIAANLYGEVLLPKKWNEYAGIMMTYGKLRSTSFDNGKKNMFFAGITTGMQPVIAKIVTIKLSTDIGYLNNGFAKSLLYYDANSVLYSGFAIMINLGVGVRL